MGTRLLQSSRIVSSLFVAALVSSAGPRVSALHDDRVIELPLPPDPGAIGTHVGNVISYVSSVTLSPPESVHRLGLTYQEIRGRIRGVGWGGSTDAGFLNCPYAYEVPYVLRIPPAWSGGLVIYRHQHDALATYEAYESFFGSRNWARANHENADRYASDVALHPNRGWAFFAVNQSGVLPGGAHDSTVLDAPGCTASTPVQSDRDVPIARDHARLAQYLLTVLREQAPTFTLGVGFVQGAETNFSLNAGVRRGQDLTAVGDNHQTPYDTTSGLIFNGFLAVDLPGVAGTVVPSASLAGLSAPTVFVTGEASVLQRGAIFQIDRIGSAPGLNVTALTRLYSIRSNPILNADFSLRMLRDDVVWTEAPPSLPALPAEYFLGTGEQIKPVIAALLDHLARWVTEGTPPPLSRFNGDVRTAPDRVEFYRTGLSSLSFPYVDDPTIDVFDQLTSTVPNAAQRAAWASTRGKLGAIVGSIVLPETACRRGGFAFLTTGPVGASVRLFDEPTFLSRWGAPAGFDSCRVQAIDALVSEDLYDPSIVAIDVDPDHSPNVIDTSASERLAVAIFSTASFDATTIVPGSLRLASISWQGEADNPGDVRWRVADVNGDGRDDLIVAFRIDRLRLNPGDRVVELWGSTRGGGAVAGTDLVEIK